MAFGEDVENALRELNRRKDELTEELEELEKKRAKGDISEDEYSQRRKKAERELVEVMDRIVQMEFLTGRR